MSRIAWNLLLVIALCALLSGGLLEAARAGPPLKFEKTSLDFGGVLRGHAVCRVFWVQNVGQKTLSLKLKSSRPDLEARVSNSVLRPGDSGNVVAALGPQETAGRLWAAISVYTSDPAQPRIDLSLTGEVKSGSQFQPVLKFEETEFDFGEIKEGARVEHVFRFRNLGEEDLAILGARPSCGCTVASFTKAVAPGGSGEVRVEFDSQGKRGYQIQNVAVSSNDAKQPTVMLRLRGNVSTTIAHSPELLFFGTIGQEERYVGKIRVWHSEGKPIRLGKLTPSSPSLKVGAVTPSEGERVWEIEVTAGPGLPVGRFYQNLEIEVLGEPATSIGVVVNGNIRATDKPAAQ